MLRRVGERILYRKFQILTLDNQRSGTCDRNISERTVASFKLIIGRYWDSFAVRVCTVSQFEVNNKCPYDVSTQTDSEGRTRHLLNCRIRPSAEAAVISH
jgi:hypothetical protein